MLNKDYILLLNILDAIDKIKRYSKSHKDADQFYTDSIAFDAAMMNFVIIGEMVSRLSDELTEMDYGIEWFKIKAIPGLNDA